MRKKLFQWLRAAMLICAMVWMASCSTDDNVIIKPADEPGAAYRAVLRGLDWAQAVAEAIFGPLLRESVTARSISTNLTLNTL